jgi:hypothetical protein
MSREVRFVSLLLSFYFPQNATRKSLDMVEMGSFDMVIRDPKSLLLSRKDEISGPQQPKRPRKHYAELTCFQFSPQYQPGTATFLHEEGGCKSWEILRLFEHDKTQVDVLGDDTCVQPHLGLLVTPQVRQA